MANEIDMEKIIDALRSIAGEPNHGTLFCYPYEAYAEFLEEKSKLLNSYKKALNLAAEEYCKILKLQQGCTELTSVDEIRAEWEYKAGILPIEIYDESESN